MGEIGLCAGSRDRYSFEVVAPNTLDTNDHSLHSPSDKEEGAEILPKARCRSMGMSVERTLAQDLVGPICRLGRYAR